MKKYNKYKDSEIEWIGEIPEHWDCEKLGKIGYFSSSGIDKKTVEGQPLVKMINYTDVYGNERKTLTSDIEYMIISCPVEKKLNHQVNIGDLIFTPSSETVEDIGLSALVIDELENTVFSYHVIRLQLNNEFDIYFRKYLCNNNFVLNQFSKEAKGTTRQIIARSIFKNIKVVIPPKSEQTAIANFLDRKTTEIDSLIAKKEKLLKLYDEEKTAIINQAVTKGIKPNVKMKDSGVEWLGEIPEHWEVKKLKYVGEIVLGKMLTSSDKGNYHKKKYLRAANLEWLNVNIENVKEMWFSIDELKRLKLIENDLLVSEGGEVGRACIWKNELDDCYIQNSVHKITFNNNHNSYYYLYQFYILGQKGVFESIVNRISIAHLTGEKIKIIDFITPSEQEQTEIVKFIETETNRINTKITKTEKLIELLREYKTALISEVVTGKIDVREEIPNG